MKLATWIIAGVVAVLLVVVFSGGIIYKPAQPIELRVDITKCTISLMGEQGALVCPLPGIRAQRPPTPEAPPEKGGGK